MAFETICEKCGAKGKIIQKKNASIFSRAVRGEGDIAIYYGEEEGYNIIRLECSKCGHKVADG